MAGERGTDGMQAPAPDSNPALYNDYYTYDYHIPAGLRTTLKLDVEHPERSVQRVGTELKFTTSQGDMIEPLYNIHRQRYRGVIGIWRKNKCLEYEENINILSLFLDWFDVC